MRQYHLVINWKNATEIKQLLDDVYENEGMYIELGVCAGTQSTGQD